MRDASTPCIHGFRKADPERTLPRDSGAQRIGRSSQCRLTRPREIRSDAPYADASCEPAKPTEASIKLRRTALATRRVI